MKRRYKEYTQNDFAALLEIDQPGVSRLLNGKDFVSFPLAVKLFQLFPNKDILEWKKTTKEGIQQLYNQQVRQALNQRPSTQEKGVSNA
jgi:plasmid maintenance system antidote protein VapI